MGFEAHYDEMMHIPRAVRFPIELVPPPGFDEERLQATVTDLVIALGSCRWSGQIAG